MSHVATIEIEVTDLGILDAACRRIGLEFRYGQTSYAWWGISRGDYPLPAGFQAEELGRCDHAIAGPPGKCRAYCQATGEQVDYEIGVVRRRDGKPGYVLLWDFMSIGLTEILGGESAGKLKQAYAVEAAKRKLLQQGFRPTEQVLPNGRIKLVAQRL